MARGACPPARRLAPVRWSRGARFLANRAPRHRYPHCEQLEGLSDRLARVRRRCTAQRRAGPTAASLAILVLAVYLEGTNHAGTVRDMVATQGKSKVGLCTGPRSRRRAWRDLRGRATTVHLSAPRAGHERADGDQSDDGPIASKSRSGSPAPTRSRRASSESRRSQDRRTRLAGPERAPRGCQPANPPAPARPALAGRGSPFPPTKRCHAAPPQASPVDSPVTRCRSWSRAAPRVQPVGSHADSTPRPQASTRPLFIGARQAPGFSAPSRRRRSATVSPTRA
jgi:hypothetical protein